MASSRVAPGRVFLLSTALTGLALVLSACSGEGPRDAGATPPGAPWSGPFGRVEVGPAAGLDPADADRLSAGEVPRIVRQSVRDWLEQSGRLATESEEGLLELHVAIGSVQLRSPWTTWLFSWAAAPDHLAARVWVAREGETLGRFDVRVESALSGWDWRDPGARLDRLARRLGRRIAAGL